VRGPAACAAVHYMTCIHKKPREREIRRESAGTAIGVESATQTKTLGVTG